MKNLQKNLLAGVGAAFLSFHFLAGMLVPAAFAQEGSGNDAVGNSNYAERISYQRYSNLSEIVTLICDDAIQGFHDFYGPATVAVAPFAVISDSRVPKITMLGITLADQMTAMINSEPAAHYSADNNYPQEMEGVIEEMDGFLRIHISGRNGLGARRGHVVNVEMSEPVYRFLHSYVESYKNN
ncbi:MAG: hypothetical protein HY885_18600 [Deltaproteobacteria bacterium]|nr:hypothetical protein [Deltaproteobacteria bacterium]